MADPETRKRVEQRRNELAEEKNPYRKWPTPKATDYFPGMGDYVTETETGYSVTRKKTGQKFGAKLSDAVDYEEKKKMWPTPAARDYKGQNSMEHLLEKPRHQGQLPNRLKMMGVNGQLNPTWVEWLMGYPIGWTDLKDSETQ